MDIIFITIINTKLSKNFKIRGNFAIDNCYITINTEDSVGHAIWAGYIKLKDFYVKLKKTYLQ